jgi:hypothetical protein
MRSLGWALAVLFLGATMAKAQTSAESVAQAYVTRSGVLSDEASALAPLKVEFDTLSLAHYTMLSDGQPAGAVLCAGVLDLQLDRVAAELASLLELMNLNTGMQAAPDQQAVSSVVWSHAQSSSSAVSILATRLERDSVSCPADYAEQAKFKAWVAQIGPVLDRAEATASRTRE